MHFIVASNGSFGDVYPFIGAARALAGRGHAVSLVCNPQYEDLSDGVEFIGASSAQALDGVIAGLDIHRIGSPSAMRRLLRGLLVEPMRSFYAAIAAAHRPGESVLLAFPLVLGARLAHDRLGLPFVSGQLVPSAFRSRRDPPRVSSLPPPTWAPGWLLQGLFFGMDWAVDRMVLTEVNRFRAELELPPIRRVFTWMDSPQRILGLFPPWFSAPQPDWPPQARLCGFPLLKTGELHPDTRRFLAQGEPPVVFTAGSPAQGVGSFFQAAVQACAQLGRRAVLLTRYRTDLPDTLPPTVHHTAYTCLRELLPRAAALVFHGGIGTSAELLRAGIPALVTPWGMDQFDNAMRLRRLGVARELPFAKITPARLARALDEVLTEAPLAAAARAAAEQLAGEQGVDALCDAMERFALRARER